jgi:type I restriction enzyme, S subunit
VIAEVPGAVSVSAEGLPEGWIRTKLPDIAHVNMGQSPPGITYNTVGDGLPFFQGKADFGPMHPTPRVWCTAPSKFALPGDVLISVRAPVGPTNVADRRCAIGRGLAAITPAGGIPTRFILYLLRLKERELAEQGSGSTFTAISRDHLNEVEVDLPPLLEQRRIVEQVDSALERVDLSRARLTRVPAILKRFRQSVLAAACSGRLTADWRSNQENFETAEGLLKRVRANLGHQSARSRRRTAQRGERARDQDLTELPEIPAEWAWIRLPELGELNRGKSRHRPRNAPHLYGGPYPFIQTGDVARSGGRITSHRQAYSEAGLAQSRLWPRGTVCITIAANIADSALLTYPACFPDSVVGLITVPSLCLPEYAELFIRTARADLSQFAPATAQKNINLEILGDVFVPLPPLAEQHEIVRRVEALFALADAVEQRVARATARADKLTQAILARAFRGELVPTEAELARREARDYEPAAALLERIRRGRAEQGADRARGGCRRRSR